MEDQTKPTLTLNPDEEKKTDILQEKLIEYK